MNPIQLSRIARITGQLLLAILLLMGLSATASAPRIVLFLGDSITAGYGLDISQGFPPQIQKKIDLKGWNFKVINAGQSGGTNAGGLHKPAWLHKNQRA